MEQRSPSVSIVRLHPDQEDEAVAVFVDAFAHDPWARNIFRGDPGSFERDVGNFFHCLLRIRFDKHEPVLGLQETDRLVAIATVEEPGPPTALADGFRSPKCTRAMLSFILRAGPAAIKRLADYGDAVAATRPPGPHFYLMGIAVPQALQGKGYGGMLLRAVHEFVDSASYATGMGLDTDSPSNVSLYTHFGYETTHVIDAAGTNTTCMFRPRGAAAGNR